jgi:spermidine synthase
MPSTFNEYYHKRTGLTVGVNKRLFSEQSPYQKVEVYETDTWGNMLTLDGLVMLSERDEFVYHEMLSHVPLFSHPHPERVLIIGGGDGGTAREVLRHPAVQTVDLVEIDETVVRAAKEFLPDVGDWENPKLNVFFEDGREYIQRIDTQYDVILIDGTDPPAGGPAKGLFERDFLQTCYERLTENGILAAQTESPWVEKYHPYMKRFYDVIDDIYTFSIMYLAYIPLYPAGMWSFAYASKGIDPLRKEVLKRVEEGVEALEVKLNYYNADVHKSCFALPNFVAEIIE